YAFEPNLRNYEVLTSNIRQNGLQNVISPYREAVSSVANQQVRFPVSAGPYNRILDDSSNFDDYELVNTTSLDAIISAHSLHSVDLLKADCAGAEYDILFHTADSSFSRIKNIKIEFHRWPVDDLREHLEKYKFKCTHIDRENAVMWLKRESQ